MDRMPNEWLMKWQVTNAIMVKPVAKRSRRSAQCAVTKARHRNPDW